MLAGACGWLRSAISWLQRGFKARNYASAPSHWNLRTVWDVKAEHTKKLIALKMNQRADLIAFRARSPMPASRCLFADSQARHQPTAADDVRGLRVGHRSRSLC